MYECLVRLKEFVQKNELFLIIAGFILSIKCLLIRNYHSTDFEVHRNWMAITYHLPLSEWYYSNVSEWTLDYPPFFAYFERILSWFARVFDEKILTLQKEPYFSRNTMFFQRFSVVVFDTIFILSAKHLAETLTVSWKNFNALKSRLDYGVFLLLVLNPCLILLDNIHFQYNSLLYSMLFYSIASILNRNYIKGALSFAILLNYKHIFLYYVPAYICFYFSIYLLPFNRFFLGRASKLFIALFVPLLISFGPFLYSGGFNGLTQILQRLFPFKRGLTHAYWAPNFWAFYNFCDFLLYKVLSHKVVKEIIATNITVQPPQYTRGIVMEYEHSALPNISVLFTNGVTIISLVPVIVLYVRRITLAEDLKFLVGVALSGYGFFLFGWHVHEKAILMIVFPVLLLVVKDLRFFPALHFLLFSSIFSVFPLFFTPYDNFLKYILGFGYLTLHFGMIFYVFKLQRDKVCGFVELIFLGLLSGVEFYRNFIHNLIFGQSVEFLCNLMLSTLCAIGVLASYGMFLYIVFGGRLMEERAHRKCMSDENNISYYRQRREKEELLDEINGKLVCGVDISALPDYQYLGIVSLTVMDAECRVVDFLDEVVLLTFDYKPEFLAVREVNLMSTVIHKFVKRAGQRPDIVFVDGNGEFHSRLCGLATHVGFNTKIASVGVAKNFNGFPLVSFGFSRDEVEKIGKMISEKCALMEAAAILDVDVTEPKFFRVIRSESSGAPLYVSAGYALDLDSATKWAFKYFWSVNGNPIRQSDRRSRSLLNTLFE